MQKNTRNLIIIITSAIVVFFGLLVFKTDSMPIFTQRIYYSIVFKVNANTDDKVFMEKVHTASKPKIANTDDTPYSFSYTRDDKENIIKDSMFCEACHGSMKQMENGKPKYRIHNKMLKVKLANFFCTTCHKKVDIGKRTPEHATIRVDRKLCTKCHESDKVLSVEELKEEVKKAKKKEPILVLIIRHGRDKENGKKWIENHGQIAKIVTTEKCRRCHKNGSELDFCKDCHGIEPK